MHEALVVPNVLVTQCSSLSNVLNCIRNAQCLQTLISQFDGDTHQESMSDMAGQGNHHLVTRFWPGLDLHVTRD